MHTQHLPAHARMPILAALTCALCAAPPGHAAELRAGAAASVITPPLGTPMAGYYHARAAEAVHDELLAKAIVLEQGECRAALVALDLITTTPELTAATRGAIEQATGIPAAHVMISATHSHTGPVLPHRGTRDEALGGRGEAAAAYLAALPARIAEAARGAVAALGPAEVQAAVGHEPTIAFNRRYHMRDGSVGWNPGKLNPGIVKPAGTIDPQVPVVLFGPAAGAPVAMYVNYTVHLDNVGGLAISADMPATLARLIGAVYGPQLVTLYTTGCCGDVNHIDVRWGQPQGGHGNAARMGTILAGEVLRTVPRLEPVACAPLQVRSEIVSLPLAPITQEQLERARAVADRLASGATPAPAFLDQVDAFKALDVAARDGRPFEVEVQAVTLGRDLAWVALPGEIFVELGLAIKQDSPFRQTMIAELANGSVGYVVPRRTYAQGAYEVVSTRCGEGAGELLVDVAVRLLRACYLAAAGSAS